MRTPEMIADAALARVAERLKNGAKMGTEVWRESIVLEVRRALSDQLAEVLPQARAIIEGAAPKRKRRKS